MKKNPFFRKTLACVFFITAFFTIKLNAQPFPSSVTDNYLASLSNLTTLNCDMVECPNYGNTTLKAIVWEDQLIVIYGTTPYSVSLPTASNFPDVVIGDDVNNLGNNYIIAVTYGAGGSSGIKLATYLFDIGALTLTPITTTSPLGVGIGAVKYSHIDLFPDPNMLVGGLPALHKFALVYHGASSAVIYTGEIDNIATSISTFSISNAIYADVAAITDMVNGRDVAAVSYINSSTGNGVVEEFDVTGGISSLGTYAFSPTLLSRIEGMGIYMNPSDAKWFVTGYSGGSVYGRTDITSTTNLTSSLGAGPNLRNAVVAAGIGTSGNTNLIGNFQYSVGWQEPGVDYFAQAADVTTGNLFSTTDYYNVPFNAVTSSMANGTNSIALSSSSNSGFGILSAWFDGSDIYYKETSNTGTPQTFGFKTNTINKIDIKNGFSIYPNPATDYLKINAPTDYEYTITDVTGKQYIHVKSTGKPADIKKLPAGMYIINISNNIDKRTIKFVKE
jgi:hypothetical protein